MNFTSGHLLDNLFSYHILDVRKDNSLQVGKHGTGIVVLPGIMRPLVKGISIKTKGMLGVFGLYLHFF